MTRRDAALTGACLVVAGASLALPWALAFDAQSWVVWGRDVVRLELDTSTGPSWKPLPVLFTTPLYGTGELAPALWLLVARAGGLLALVGAFRLAARLAGRAAGAAAAGVLALSPWWFYNTALGNSEGLLVAAVLWAVLAQLEERPRLALALWCSAGLLRPEVWPFLGLQALWLWRERPSARPYAAGVLALVPLLWFGPDVLGAGGALTASDAALGTATEQSAQNDDVPALAVLGDFALLLTLPAVVLAAVGLVSSGRTERLLGAGAASYVLLVAAMTQAGYAGNPRYLVPAAGVGAVLAGVGAARVGVAAAQRVRAGGARVLAPVAAGALVVAVALVSLSELGEQVEEVGERADRRGSLDVLVERAGGETALRACGPVGAQRFVRPLVAWELDLPLDALEPPARPPGTVLRAEGYRGEPLEPPPPPGFALAERSPGWEVRTGCG